MQTDIKNCIVKIFETNIQIITENFHTNIKIYEIKIIGKNISKADLFKTQKIRKVVNIYWLHTYYTY